MQILLISVWPVVSAMRERDLMMSVAMQYKYETFRSGRLNLDWGRMMEDRIVFLTAIGQIVDHLRRNNKSLSLFLQQLNELLQPDQFDASSRWTSLW